MHRRRLALLSLSVVALMLTPVRPAGAEPTLLADTEVTGVTVSEEGLVRVIGNYVCPSGYAASSYGSTAFVYQYVGNRVLGRRKQFASRVRCDGIRNGVAIKFRKDEHGEPFRADLPVVARISLAVEVSIRRGAGATDEEIHTTERTVAAIELRDVTVRDDGVLRITGSYICPTGSTVHTAAVNMVQLTRGGDEVWGEKRKSFARRIECDARRNEVAVTVPDTKDGDPWRRGLQTYGEFAMAAFTPEGDVVHTFEARALIP